MTHWIGTSWKMHKTLAEARTFAAGLPAQGSANKTNGGGGQGPGPCDDRAAGHFGVRKDRSVSDRMKPVICRT